MSNHISYGVIPIFKSNQNENLYLILRNNGGFWGFPKGHSENNETAEATAVRELYEETGLAIDPNRFGSPVHYEYSQPIEGVIQTKRIVLFPVVVTSKEVNIQLKEISDYKWASFDEAIALIGLPGIMEPLAQVHHDADRLR